METDMLSLFAGLLDSNNDLIIEEPVIDPGVERWLPAFFESGEKVVDPTVRPPIPPLLLLSLFFSFA